ncbi:MAG TPA: serine hydrolase [Hyphomicrobiaceae bacterium]|nr:serine hydrolase [Hyphomicrobiaceae bacterium]
MAKSAVTAALLVGATLIMPVTNAPALAATRHAAMVIDANTGAVLYEQFADAPRHPASLTKMMTLYLLFEQIEQGNLTNASKISVSAAAAAVAPSKLDLEPGEEIDVADAVKALITKSANDVAVAVAEHISGSEAGFVRLMNERARQIGMGSTVFTNASGLPNRRQITTVRDILTLALRLQDDFPRQAPLFALKSFEFRGKTHRTHNTLMYGFPGMDGIKTGYTRASGFNLVSSVHIDGKHVVAALFGGATASARNAHMRLMLYRALQKASKEKTRQPRPAPVARRGAAPQTAAKVQEGAKQRPVRKTETRDEARIAAGAAPKTAPAAQPSTEVKAGPPPGPVTTPPVPEAMAPTPQIEIARVHPVRIAPESAPAASAKVPPQQPNEADGTAAAASALPRLDFEGLRAAISSEASSTAAPALAPARSEPPASIETIIAETSPSPPGADRPPSMLEEHVAILAESPPEPGRPPANFSGRATALGRAPSTLEIQAANLGGADAPAGPDAGGPPAASTQTSTPDAASGLKGPVSEPAAAPAGGGFEIQIGAYASAEEAERRLASARARAVSLLDGHPSLSRPVQKGDRQMFRARFAGFDGGKASRACLELKRVAIDCLVMKAD